MQLQLSFNLIRKGISLILVFFISLIASADELNVENKVALKKSYKFTEDVFSSHCQEWPELLKPFFGKPNLKYLEVGVFEGRSMVWMLENVLTDKTSRATAIDTFPDDLMDYFANNLKVAEAVDKVTILKGKSEVMLRPLEINSFDIIYIDGSHRARDVYIDAALSWGLLKTGGYLIFDDYEWLSELSPELSPKVPLNAFLSSFYGEYELLGIGKQVRIKKLASTACSEAWRCSVFGPFEYNWRKKSLVNKSGKEIKLSENELALLEKILHVRFFDTQYQSEEFDKNPIWQSLSKKLNISIKNSKLVF